MQNQSEINENTKYIAFTFDDGPNTATTVQILDILEAHHAAATFFLVGNNITDVSAQVVKRAFDMGCEIANHSLTHADLSQMTANEIRAEVEPVSQRIQGITGQPPRFFRPPYIAVSDTLYDTVKMPFLCGLGAEDYSPAVSAEERYTRIMAQAEDGAIILLHDMDGNAMTVEAVSRLIPALQQQGYVFVTVSELFAMKGIVPKAGEHVLYSYAR